ncbi:MAG TPA: amidohydrolase family protein [Pirellulales bacterium]|nr:amidohydrolase family protein [Pirellulales bacterium]
MSLSIALKARFVFPVSGPPAADGVVTLAGDRIAAVGPTADGPCEIEDLGNVAILPGLVNAHTHLEFSALPRPLGEPGMAFPDWIRRAVEFRRGRANDPRGAVRQGLEESLRAGATLLGEIAQPGWPREEFDASPIEAAIFLESIGLAADRAANKLDEARRHLAAPRGAGPRPGLSPHAPYTVHPELFAGLTALAAAADAPLAFHLAESREELELLLTGGGPFRELLESLGAWDPAAIPRGTRPIDYLRRLAEARVRALVVHGNYLDAEEIAIVAQARERMSVVYCPRTHAFFRHSRHPLPRLLAAGANVAIGTDSRASNPDLSVLEELRLIAREFPELRPAAILELGTLRGAQALGQADRAGSLAPGKLANLAIVALADRDAVDPHELLFDSALPVVKTICRGRAWQGVESKE